MVPVPLKPLAVPLVTVRSVATKPVTASLKVKVAVKGPVLSALLVVLMVTVGAAATATGLAAQRHKDTKTQRHKDTKTHKDWQTPRQGP